MRHERHHHRHPSARPDSATDDSSLRITTTTRITTAEPLCSRCIEYGLRKINLCIRCQFWYLCSPVPEARKVSQSKSYFAIVNHFDMEESFLAYELKKK